MLAHRFFLGLVGGDGQIGGIDGTVFDQTRGLTVGFGQFARRVADHPCVARLGLVQAALTRGQRTLGQRQTRLGLLDIGLVADAAATLGIDVLQHFFVRGDVGAREIDEITVA